MSEENKMLLISEHSLWDWFLEWKDSMLCENAKNAIRKMSEDRQVDPDKPAKECRIKPLNIKPIEFGSEAAKQYKKSLEILQRIIDASKRARYEDGETMDDILMVAKELLDCEELELSVFGTPDTNSNWPRPLKSWIANERPNRTR